MSPGDRFPTLRPCFARVHRRLRRGHPLGICGVSRDRTDPAPSINPNGRHAGDGFLCRHRTQPVVPCSLDRFDPAHDHRRADSGLWVPVERPGVLLSGRGVGRVDRDHRRDCHRRGPELNTVEIANRRKLWYLVGKRTFAALFVIAGVGHFVATDFFLKIMPPYLPFHLPLVLVSGLIEILLGILLLVPRYSRLAAWGIIALLIAVFPANIYVYTHQELFPFPWFLHLLRLPLQGVLILWAFVYTRQ